MRVAPAAKGMADTSLHFWEGEDFGRYLADLISAEIAWMRPATAPRQSGYDSGLSFYAGGLALDSLESLQLATAVASALQLQRSSRPDRLQRLETFGDWIAECRLLLREGGGTIGFKSSGSAGAPRLVVHEMSALAQEVELLAQRFVHARRIVSFAPAHHIYGFLFTVLLPRRLGVHVMDARAHSVLSIQSLLREGDLLIAYPTLWQAAARSPLRAPNAVEGVSSGAPFDPSAAAALRNSSLASLVEIYGSTETAGVAWREDAGDFRLFPYWRKHDEDNIVKQLGDRTVSFRLPDFVAWRDDKSFMPLRRRDGAVQVAGVNVYPELVRSCLMAHEDVADARVRLMQPHEGARLKAFIVPKRAQADIAALRAALERWVEERLIAQRPASPRIGRQGQAKGSRYHDAGLSPHACAQRRSRPQIFPARRHRPGACRH